MTADKIEWIPNYDFSSVPEFMMNQIKTIAPYIEFVDSDINGTIAFKTIKYNFCDGTATQHFAITKVPSGLTNANDIKVMHCKIADCNFNQCLCRFKKDIKSCPETWTLPTGKCPVMLAAYYKYLHEYNPKEYTRQRKEYKKNKDIVDGTILKGFKFFGPIKELPLMPSKLLKEIRKQIDKGNFELREGKNIAFYLYDLEENFACNENRWSKGGNFDKTGVNILVNYLHACKNNTYRWTGDKDQERIYLILYVLKLLNLGLYSTYENNVFKKEKKVKKLKGLGYYGYIAGNDKNEVRKAVEEKAFQISYSFNIPRLGYEQVSAIDLAQALAETDNNNLNPQICYHQMSDDKIYLITGLEEFCNFYKEKDMFGIVQRQFNHFFKQLSSLESNKYILLAGTPKEINDFIKLDKGIEFLFSQNGHEIKDATDKELFAQFCQKLPANFNIPVDAEEQFVNYLSVNKGAFPFNNSSLAKFLADYAISLGKFTFPYNYSDIKRQEFMDDINKLIGLEELKQQMISLYNLASFRKAMSEHGLQLDSTNMHMVFEGNPGTGKTTAARLIATALYNIGIIKTNKVVECERKDLVAGYIGQTAIKTDEKIQEALGGVLFIDEAYSLTGLDKKDFGNEAIATLVKAMEDHKDDLVVIYAGYSLEMKEFIDSNPGIKSRIGFNFHFPDYNENELLRMYIDKIKKSGFNLNDGCATKIKAVITEFIHEPNFGNGRFIERMFQATLQNKANRFANETNKDFISISIDDIPNSSQIKKLYPNEIKKKAIGFQT